MEQTVSIEIAIRLSRRGLPQKQTEFYWQKDPQATIYRLEKRVTEWSTYGFDAPTMAELLRICRLAGLKNIEQDCTIQDLADKLLDFLTKKRKNLKGIYDLPELEKRDEIFVYYYGQWMKAYFFEIIAVHDYYISVSFEKDGQPYFFDEFALENPDLNPNTIIYSANDYI